MRRLGFILVGVLLLGLLSFGGLRALAQGAGAPIESSELFTLGVVPNGEGVPEECTFRFYNGEEQVTSAAQGALIRVEVVLPKSNTDGWRLRPNTLTMYYVENEEEGVNFPLGEMQFKMPNRHVKVGGHFVKGFTISNAPSTHGELEFGSLTGYRANDVVEFTARAYEGCQLEAIRVTVQGSEVPIECTAISGFTDRFQFRMPEQDVSVKSTFVMKEYSISVVVNVDEKGKGCNLHFDKMEGLHFKDQVTVTPQPAYRYRIKKGSLQMRLKSHQTPVPLNPNYDDTTGAPFVFSMPSDDAEILVSFERNPNTLSKAKIVVNRYVDPTPSSDVNNRVEVRHASTRAVVKGLVQEGEKLFVRCWPAPGYYMSALQLLDSTYRAKDSVAFVVPEDVAQVEVRAFFRKKAEQDDKPTAVDAIPSVAVYPNPFRGELHVEADGVERVALYSLEGVLVHSQPYGSGRIEVPPLPAGLYMLHVHFKDGGVLTRSVVR